jgi:hypothetical protein
MNQERDALGVVFPAMEHRDDVASGARADPKAVWFGVVDVSLCLDVPECNIHLLCVFSGRCHFSELMELSEAYVLKRTCIIPFGISWYRMA